MKFTVSKKKLLINRILMIVGFIICIPAAFTKRFFFAALGVMISIICALNIDDILRCPKCRRNIADRQSGILFTIKPLNFCPKCGMKIEVEYE